MHQFNLTTRHYNEFEVILDEKCISVFDINLLTLIRLYHMEYKSHLSDYIRYYIKRNQFQQEKIITRSKTFHNHFLA